MATYSIIEFTTVLMLYRLNSNLGDWQYFYIDLVIVLVLSLVGEKTKPFKGILAKKSPLSSLITFPVLCSLISQITIQLLLLILTYKYMQSEPWFVPLIQVKNTENVKCLENTVLFCLCSFLMINIAVAFAAGPPHRSPVYTNCKFVASNVVHLFMAKYLFGNVEMEPH
jgi:cation-transporting ATPase 13A3/4/5